MKVFRKKVGLFKIKYRDLECDVQVLKFYYGVIITSL